MGSQRHLLYSWSNFRLGQSVHLQSLFVLSSKTTGCLFSFTGKIGHVDVIIIFFIISNKNGIYSLCLRVSRLLKDTLQDSQFSVRYQYLLAALLCCSGRGLREDFDRQGWLVNILAKVAQRVRDASPSSRQVRLILSHFTLCLLVSFTPVTNKWITYDQTTSFLYILSPTTQKSCGTIQARSILILEIFVLLKR